MEDFYYVELPLKDSPFYTYSISLENDSYQLQFTYNEKMQLYTMSISDASANLLISSVAVVPNYPITADYIIPGLTGAFFLIPNDDSGKEYYKLYPDKIHQYYKLIYLYENPTV